MRDGMTLAVQLWTLRNLCARDFFGTLEKLAALGCRHVEPYDFYDANAAELRARLDDLGLSIPSSHVSINLLESRLDEVMDFHEAIGCNTIVCPWLDEDRRADAKVFEKTGRFLCSISPTLRARGFDLLYHNHEFEFTLAKNPDGLQRILAENPDGYLGIQLDTYWCHFTGRDPVEYMRSLGMRLRSLHLKDPDSAGGFAPVGQGAIDMRAVIAEGLKMGVRSFVIEQDEHKLPPLESVRLSLEFVSARIDG